MGIFTRSNNSDLGYFGESSDLGTPDWAAYDGGEFNVMEESYRVLAESQANYNNIMQAVGLHELHYFEENGEEFIYEASSMSGFLDKVKAFFKKLWEKIKTFFGKFIAMWDAMTKDDSAFVNKYKKQILSVGNLDDLTFNGYKFTLDEIKIDKAKLGAVVKEDSDAELASITTAASAASIDATQKENIENLDVQDFCEKIRGGIIEHGGEKIGTAYTASEYSKELFELLRDGETSKQTLDDIKPVEELTIIKGSNDVKKEMVKTMKNSEKEIQKVIKEIEKDTNKLIKETPKNDTDKVNGVKIQALTKAFQLEQSRQNDVQTLKAAKLTAWKDQNRQARAICVKLMQHGNKKVNESYDFDNYDPSNPFANVNLI